MEQAAALGLHRVFHGETAEGPQWDSVFGEARQIVARIEKMAGLSSLKEFMAEFGSGAGRKELIRKSKLCAIPYARLRLNPAETESVLTFAREFLETPTSETADEFLKGVQSLTAASLGAKPDPKKLLESTLPSLEERGLQLPLSLVHLAAHLGDDETELAEFFVWGRRKGLRLKISARFRELGL